MAPRASRFLGEGQLSLTKFLPVTVQAVDLKDFRATLERRLARAGDGAGSGRYIGGERSWISLEFRP